MVHRRRLRGSCGTELVTNTARAILTTATSETLVKRCWNGLCERVPTINDACNFRHGASHVSDTSKKVGELL